ncbi:MAG: HigA family addiction module antidote protein [Alphaproteobacteria bacterium]|nr:HigA family addiction module antidote protein [Alphaproteobacteria bacterium]
MTEKFIEPEPVGQMLKVEFLEPLKLSQNALAQAIGVPSNRINGIINGTRGITADTDLRLTRYFGLTEGFFLRYQNRIELVKAKHRIHAQLDNIVPFRRPAPVETSEELLER